MPNRVTGRLNPNAAFEKSHPPLPRGWIDGFKITTDGTEDIVITAGQCRDSSNAVNIVLPSSITKLGDATWAVGSGNGGLNATDFASGSSDLEASTWYHFHVIMSGSGVVDAGIDKSVTAANLLADSGYGYYRRIGSGLTDGSNNFLTYAQIQETFIWSAPVEDYAAADPASTELTTTLSVPTGVNVWAHISLRTSSSSGNSSSYFRLSPNASNQAAGSGRYSLVAGRPGGNDTDSASNISVLTNTSAQIKHRHDATVDSLNIATLGWTDFRGRNA